MRIAPTICVVVAFVTALLAAAQPPTLDDAALAPAPEALLDPGATLPNEPAKTLVFARCNTCHGLAWIERSGGTEEGWRSRLQRMNRAGAMIPLEEIPLLAAYLAKALPERLRPPPPPKLGASARR